MDEPMSVPLNAEKPCPLSNPDSPCVMNDQGMYTRKVLPPKEATKEALLDLIGRMRDALNNCCNDCNLYKEPYCTKDMRNRCVVPKLIVEVDKLKKEG